VVEMMPPSDMPGTERGNLARRSALAIVSNLMLGEVHNELSRRSHHLCRYAPECVANALKEVHACRR
jgi:hypothetical protein